MVNFFNPMMVISYRSLEVFKWILKLPMVHSKGISNVNFNFYFCNWMLILILSWRSMVTSNVLTSGKNARILSKDFSY